MTRRGRRAPYGGSYGHSRRFLRVPATSGYLPKLTLKTDVADRQTSVLGRRRAVAAGQGGGECRNKYKGGDNRFREENAPDIADSMRSG